MKQKLKYLKPYHDFESRSGVKPNFDKGDIVTNGVDNILIVNINSASDGNVYYSVISPKSSVCPETKISYNGLNPSVEYHRFNRNHKLVKKGDLKTKYALSNDCHLPIEGVVSSEDIIDMAFGNKPWHTFFERNWSKEWGEDEPKDISWRGY